MTSMVLSLILLSISPILTNRKMRSTVPVVESLDRNYRIYVKQYLMNKTNDYIYKSEEEIENKNKSGIILNGHHLPAPQPLMSHKITKTSENFSLNSLSAAKSKSLEFSKNVTIILGDLLVDYDRNQRPGYGGPEAVITSNLEIRSMGPISELDMEYSLDCYFRQKWLDKRLGFSGPSDFLSLNINMLDKIWKPDTYFHTGKGSHLHTITRPNKFVRIYQNGAVLYSMRLTIKSLCPMDLHHFPMDKQSCPLIFGSYGYPNDQVVYNWDEKPVNFNNNTTLSQFDLLNYPCRNGTVRFKRGNYSMLQVNFNLRRHVGYFLIQIYVPCSLIVVLSWVSFWINREATADRVGLGVTAVLTLSTFGLDSRKDLPRVSYATALDWFTIMCFLFVVFTLLEFAGVHYFTKVGTGEVPFVEIDEDWAQEKYDDESENPLNIIAPPKAYQNDEKKVINRYDGRQNRSLQNSRRRAKKYRIYDAFDVKYSNIYCPKHGFKSVDSHLDKYKKFETLEQYLSDRIRATAELNDQIPSDLSDDNYEDIDDTDYEYEMELNSQYNHPNDQYIPSNTNSSQNSGFTSKLLNFFVNFYYCLTVSQSYKEQMRRRRVRGQGLTAANSVSMIDKTSRILFPFVWFLLNLFYWVFLIIERNSEFKM